ncbi:hypothetical protein H4R24_002247 [Coemansia sp. RSA 988]|nr:hypothetical protein H4R24_002247 [Coemansia sp. RSA 988]
MAELVAFEDSPLGQYLQECGSSEALVVDDKSALSSALYEIDVTNMNDNQTGISKTWTNWLTQYIGAFPRLVFDEPSSCGDNTTIASLTCSKLVELLTDSGHMVDKYTPKKMHILSNSPDNITLATTTNKARAIRDTAMRIVPASVIGGVLLGRQRYPNNYTSIPSKIASIVAAGMFAIMSAVAAHSLARNISAARALRRANAYITDFYTMLFYSRMLDNSLHRELCFVQEMDLISRGFRLPLRNPSIQLSQHRPSRGTLFVAQHLRQKIGLVLVQSIRTLTDIVQDMNIADNCINSDLYNELHDSSTECLALIESSQYSDCLLSLEYLRQAFAAQFTLRRLWLECVLYCFRIAADSANSQSQLLGLFQSTTKPIQRLRTTATGGLDELKSVREAQYAAPRWKEFAEPPVDGNQNAQPLIRSLANMSDVLTTLQAKVLICQECVYAADDIAVQAPNTSTESHLYNERSPEDIARLFASLKSEIDMLGTHYQEATTRLLCSENPKDNILGIDFATIGADSRIDALELNSDDVPSDARVFGYTSLAADGLDVPEMTFEADVEASQHVSRREQPALDRNERIRIQRQRRVDDEAINERKKEAAMTMLELKSTIHNLAKRIRNLDTDEHNSDDHLDDGKDIERTK